MNSGLLQLSSCRVRSASSDWAWKVKEICACYRVVLLLSRGVSHRLQFIQYRIGVWKCLRSLSPDSSPSTGYNNSGPMGAQFLSSTGLGFGSLIGRTKFFPENLGFRIQMLAGNARLNAKIGPTLLILKLVPSGPKLKDISKNEFPGPFGPGGPKSLRGFREESK